MPYQGAHQSAGSHPGFLVQDYPTPAMRALGMLCSGGWLWTDPCRTEFRRK